jgi:hypothetical protein
LSAVTRITFATMLTVLISAGCAGADSAADDTDVSSVASPVAGDPWCPAGRAVREAGAALDFIDASDPAEVADAVDQLVDRLQEAEAVAPDEIAAAVALTADSAREFQSALAAVEYEIVRADLSSILGPDNQVAGRTIDAYNVEVCGFEPTIPSGTSPLDTSTAGTGSGDDGEVVFDPADGPIRDQAIALLVEEGFSADQAACLFDGLDLDDVAALSDPAVEAELLDQCDVDASMLPGADR